MDAKSLELIIWLIRWPLGMLISFLVHSSFSQTNYIGLWSHRDQT